MSVIQFSLAFLIFSSTAICAVEETSVSLNAPTVTEEKTEPTKLNPLSFKRFEFYFDPMVLLSGFGASAYLAYLVHKKECTQVGLSPDSAIVTSKIL